MTVAMILLVSCCFNVKNSCQNTVDPANCLTVVVCVISLGVVS